MPAGRASFGPGGDPFEQDPSVQSANTPLWREILAPLEWLQLHCSPVYYGCGVRYGHGEPVVVIPGFLGSDVYLTELFSWLGRIGYVPYFSHIGQNADCPDHLAGVLLQTVRRARHETGMKPRLIGHSLGGMLARTLALEYPHHVGGVISMGSPFKDAVRAHPMIMTAADALRRGGRRGGVGANIKPSCFSGHCTCTFVKNMLAPGKYEVPHFAIYSRTDGVVEWESCVEDDKALNDEVSSTHVGMAFHAGTYRVLARRLAEMRAA
jgi:pimeloyl-ACP methyl ester carboxylesterase